MKKLLVAVLAFALFAPAFAVENVRVTGDIQTIGISFDDHGLSDFNLKGTTNRVLLGLEADLVEDVQARLTFAHRNVFGYNETNGETVDNVWERTHVAEAFVKISNIFDALEVKVGRQFYGDEKSAVLYFGPDYGYAVGNVYTSLDGTTATYRGEKFALTAAYFSVNSYNDSDTLYPVRDRDANFGGLDLDVKVNDNISANAYIYDFEGFENVEYGFWGAKAALDYEHFKLGAEFARNYSVGNDKGWQVKADLALPISLDETTLTPRVTYLKSEKDFVAYGNYRPGLMFGTLLGGGVNNILSALTYGNETLSNWEILNIGLCMKFAGLEKLGFGLDFYTATEEYNDFIGNSWEAKIVYNHNEYVSFNLTGAILTNAGHSWKHSPTAAQLGMNIKF